MTNKVVINERAVRSMMGAMGIRSILQLSEQLQPLGLGKNTIYDVINGGAFSSSTLNVLVEFFGCKPGDLLEVIEVDENGDAQHTQAVALVGGASSALERTIAVG